MKLTRRQALAGLGTLTLTAPHVWTKHNHQPPSTSIRHASFGGGGMAWADIESLSQTKGFQLIAVADVDTSRFEDIRKRFPDVRLYPDWRKLLDQEKGLDSANISTPDHMHAPITMRAMRQGLSVYTQKPLTHTLFDARALATFSAQKPIVTQMGIQIHSHPIHRKVVAMIQSGVLGKIKEVHSWSGKDWGDPKPLPDRADPIPVPLDWNGWLGVARERAYLKDYYHPGNWRRRLDFGTGTFGDMGCHILDPVFESLSLTHPKWVICEKGGATPTNWGLNHQVKYEFPGTATTSETLTITWYDGALRPPAELAKTYGLTSWSDQGSVYLGEKGALYSPYIDEPQLLPRGEFSNAQPLNPPGADHYNQFLEAVRGTGKTSTPFSFSGPLTEMVLLGCLATRFPNKKLDWDKARLRVTNLPEANLLVRKTYRRGFEVEGLG